MLDSNDTKRGLLYSTVKKVQPLAWSACYSTVTNRAIQNLRRPYTLVLGRAELGKMKR